MQISLAYSFAYLILLSYYGPPHTGRTPNARINRRFYPALSLPIGDRTIKPMQVGQLGQSTPGTGCATRGRAVLKLHAQARGVRWEEISLSPLGCTGNTSVSVCPAARLLLDAEIAGGQVEVQAGRRGDGPQWVVGRQVDVMRLAPAGDLTRLGEPADDAQVDPGVVHRLLFDQLPELPLGGELLAGSHRHRWGEVEGARFPNAAGPP